MKTLLKKISVSFILAATIFNFAFAGELAYIVKQDGLKVFLDISEVPNKPAEGTNFRVVEWGEEIINPKTGKSLGKEIKRTTTGRITQVEDLYAIGSLDSDADVLHQEAEFRAPVNPAATHTAFKENNNPPDGLNQDAQVMPIWRSQVLEGEIKGIASGDLTGDGASELVLAFTEDNTLKTYSLAPDNTLKLIAELSVNNLRRIVSVDVADVKKTGRAQIYAVVYDDSAQKFSTFVYELTAGKLVQTDTINSIVKGISPYNGPRVLYRQEVNPTSSSMSRTTPTRLLYVDGKYVRGEKVIFPKFDNVFGFNLGDFRHNEKKEVVFVLGKKIRLQFANKKNFVDTADDMDFSTTPIRVSYKRVFERLPASLALFKNSEGETFLAAVENKAKLGMLADTFGSYNNARLYFLKWTGNSIIKDSYADIEGVVYDIFQGSLGNYKNVILVPFAGGGASSVLLFNAK